MPTPKSDRQALLGPANRFFADRRAGTPRHSFQMLDTASRAYKDSPYHALDSSQLEPIPMPSPSGPMTLESVIGATFLAPIEAQRKISFHAVGDTGASTPGALQSEDSVSAAMVHDLQGDPALAPAFFFHLGDVVYFFGEGSNYYAQFFQPFQTYDRPILPSKEITTAWSTHLRRRRPSPPSCVTSARLPPGSRQIPAASSDRR